MEDEEEYNDDCLDDEEEETKYEDGDITEDGKPYVKLIGKDGNAMNIIGLCMRAGRKAKFPKEKLDEFMNKAMSGDYNKVLATAMEYFDVD
jgi:hypothetical protein